MSSICQANISTKQITIFLLELQHPRKNGSDLILMCSSTQEHLAQNRDEHSFVQISLISFRLSWSLDNGSGMNKNYQPFKVKCECYGFANKFFSICFSQIL